MVFYFKDKSTRISQPLTCVGLFVPGVSISERAGWYRQQKSFQTFFIWASWAWRHKVHICKNSIKRNDFHDKVLLNKNNSTSKVPAIQGLRRECLLLWPRSLLLKFLNLYKILRKYVSQNTVNTAAAINYKNRSQLSNLSPSEWTQRLLDWFTFCRFWSKPKLGFEDGLTGFDLKCSAFDKTTPQCGNLCGSHERPVYCLWAFLITNF